MFIFYYAVLSEVSPPTALSPFAAAAITGGDPYVTTMQAWKYTLPAFLVPFVFVLDPQGVGLLMKIPKDGSVYDIIWVTLKTGDRAGRARRGGAELGAAPEHPIERGLWLLSGLLLVFPSLLEGLAETITGLDVPHPAPFGLALGAASFAKAEIRSAKTGGGNKPALNKHKGGNDVESHDRKDWRHWHWCSAACWLPASGDRAAARDLDRHRRHRRRLLSARRRPRQRAVEDAARACRRPPKSPAARSTISS